MNKTKTKLKLNLKKNGFTKGDLLRVYVSMVRPLAEYCSSVFHALITKTDSDEFERIQAQSLKVIYGRRHSSSELLELSGLETVSYTHLTLPTIYSV